MVDFTCCPHVAELRSALVEEQSERVRLEIDNARLQQEIEELVSVIEGELEHRNHERQFVTDV
jgi:hypothetical protein